MLSSLANDLADWNGLKANLNDIHIYERTLSAVISHPDKANKRAQFAIAYCVWQYVCPMK